MNAPDPTTPSFAPPPERPAAPVPPLRRIGRSLAFFAVALVVGQVVGRLLARSLEGHVAPDFLRMHDLAWIPLGWLVAVAVHEAGHLACGALMDMRPVLYVVGPLRLTRDGGGFRLAFNTHFATWGGLAAAVPRDTDRFAARMAWMVAGGPLASVALALVGAAAAWAFPVAAAPFALTALLSACIAVVTLLPTRAGGFMSDGAQLLAYRRGGADIERRALLLALAGASMAGVRPREWDRTLLERALEPGGDAVARIAMVTMAASAAVDRGEDAAAHFAELAASFRDYPDGFRQSLALWLAWYAAAQRRDLALARTWLALGRGGIVDGALRELAEAAVAALAGDAAARDAAIARAAKRGAGMDLGTDRLVRELLAATSAP